MKKEIERKFIIEKVGQGVIFLEDKSIHQTYLSVKDNEELRVRMEVENNEKTFTMTHKKGSGMTREETEFQIGEKMYYDLTDKVREKTLIKNRRASMVGDYTVTVDTYGQEFEGMMTAEVEFETEEEAIQFQAPKWFGRDVTEDATYKNKNLWKKLQ